LSDHPLLSWLRDQKEAMATLLEDLALLETPSTEPATLEPAFERLASELDTVGFRSLRVPGRTTGGLLMSRPRERRRGAPCQLVIGHMDTVWPVGTLLTMPVRRDERVMAGPGVYDMKGGLTQLVFALRALRALGRWPDVTPVVLVNADEEIGSHDTERHIVRLARGANRAYVLEPSLGPDGRLKTGRKGLGRFTITVHGKAAHAGLDPTAGASAILELSHQIQRLFALNDPARGISVNVGTIDGGLRPNVVAPTSSAVVDVRVPDMADAQRIEDAIHRLAPVTPGTSLEVVGNIGRPPMARSPQLWALAHDLAGELGLELAEATAGGGSDGNTTSQLTPTLDGLGPVGDGAHAVHEHLVLDHLVERAALLALLLDAPPLERR
jgi:glutamate carboxypeptidase